MLVALSGQIIVIADPSVWGFEGIIERFEVTAIGTNVSGKEILPKNFSFITWSVLAYRAQTHDGQFVRGWNGAFILQNSPFAC